MQGRTWRQTRLASDTCRIVFSHIANIAAAAKTALRRKKELEHDLEQNNAQMITLQRQVSSIETANINKETLDAMAQAAKAMKDIHNGTTIDTVDATMEKLREQEGIASEIAEAITSGGAPSRVDEDELDEELANLQQEALDDAMLRTGNPPISDRISALPNQPNGPSKFRTSLREILKLTSLAVTSRHNAEEEEEEELLRKLQAEMAM